MHQTVRKACSNIRNNIHKHADNKNARTILDGTAFKRPAQICSAQFLNTDSSPTTKVDVVVCGGGLVGCSVAYAIAKHGNRSVLVIERGKFSSGSTGQLSGFVQQFGSHHVETSLCRHTNFLYRDLMDFGYPIGLQRCGGVSIARTRDRMVELQRIGSIGLAQGYDCKIVNPHEIKDLVAGINIDDVHGGLYVPADGVVDPVAVTHALTDHMQNKLGVTLRENCEFTRVKTAPYNGVQKVIGLETNLGDIECSVFVNCAGLNARALGLRNQVKVPTVPCVHQMLVTQNANLSSSFPVVRDWDGGLYVRQLNGAYVVGGFERNARVMADRVSSQPPPEADYDQFQEILEQFIHRFPKQGAARVETLRNMLECFTPDGQWIIGEAPEIMNYFIASGMNGRGSEVAGGVGRYLADLVLRGKPRRDIWNFEPSRFNQMHNNVNYLRDRGSEVVAETVAIAYPFKIESAPARCRRIRTSPLYAPFKTQAGAVFGQFNGYERALWFEHEEVEDVTLSAGFRMRGKPSWFPYVEHEYHACRTRVALIDMSSFSKFVITSNNADEVVQYLQYLCSNDVDIPPGRICHSGLQNSYGGYENDVSVARLDKNSFLIVGPTGQQTRALYWFLRHRPQNSSIVIEDVTSLYTGINVIGPLSRDVMSHFTDVSSSEFPFFSFKHINVGYASEVLAMNLTHTGEAGWILYIPNEYALHVYETLLEVGRQYQITHAGHLTMRALRTERLYGYWGQDLDTSTTPLECGRTFRVRFDKELDFIGKQALLDEAEVGPTRMYVQLVLDDFDNDADAWPMGGEPIFRDGIYVGKTTTTAYGFTFQRQVCLGYVKNIKRTEGETVADGVPQVITPEFVQSGKFEVDVAGKRFPARVNIRSPRLPMLMSDVPMELAASMEAEMAYAATQQDDNNNNAKRLPISGSKMLGQAKLGI